MNKKLLSILSICKKAGKVISGEFSVLKAIQSETAVYIIIAENASQNTQKKFKDKATYYNIDYVVYGDKDALSHAIGNVNRTTFAITDEGFYKKMKMYIEEEIK